MIIGCPQCSTEFNLASQQITEEGLKVRCSRCQHVFRVYPETPASTSPISSSPENATPHNSVESRRQTLNGIKAVRRDSVPDAHADSSNNLAKTVDMAHDKVDLYNPFPLAGDAIKPKKNNFFSQDAGISPLEDIPERTQVTDVADIISSEPAYNFAGIGGIDLPDSEVPEEHGDEMMIDKGYQAFSQAQADDDFEDNFGKSGPVFDPTQGKVSLTPPPGAVSAPTVQNTSKPITADHDNTSDDVSFELDTSVLEENQKKVRAKQQNSASPGGTPVFSAVPIPAPVTTASTSHTTPEKNTATSHQSSPATDASMMPSNTHYDPPAKKDPLDESLWDEMDGGYSAKAGGDSKAQLILNLALIVIVLINGMFLVIAMRNDGLIDFKEFSQMIDNTISGGTYQPRTQWVSQILASIPEEEIEPHVVEDVFASVVAIGRRDKVLVIQGNVRNQSDKSFDKLDVRAIIQNPHGRVIAQSQAVAGQRLTGKDFAEIKTKEDIGDLILDDAKPLSQNNSVPFTIIFEDVPELIANEEPVSYRVEVVKNDLAVR